MTLNDYWTLASSNSSISGRVRVLVDGYSRKINKKQSFDTLADGTDDVCFGSLQKTYTIFIRVRHTEESGYLTLANIEALYSLNNPNGTPSVEISATDNVGTVMTGYLIGEFSESLLSAVITGYNAWYIIALSFKVKSV